MTAKQAGTAAVFTLIGGIALAYFTGLLAPKTLDAKIDKPTINTGVTLREHLEETKNSTSEFSVEELALVGYVVQFHLTLVGFKGRKCTARWEVFDNASKSRVLFADWNKVQEPVEMIPEAATDSASAHFWVPPLKGPGDFFVRVRIYDDKGVELTQADTDVIKTR